MKSIFLTLSIFSSFILNAQSDTTKVEQYCELVAQGRLLSRKVTIDVDFGEERKLFSGDMRVRDELTGRIKKFNSVTDALNYMGTQGWTLVNAFPTSESSGPKVYHFYFKKLFRKEDILKTNTDDVALQ